MQIDLKAARDDKEWTLETLAQKSGVNKSTISRLERGATLPMHDTVKALEKALGLKRGTLVFGQRDQAVA